MNIPAYAAPTLCIGRTYDAGNVKAGIDIFPSNIPAEKIKKMNVNNFTFKYKVVQNSNDVKDLLGISGELSLKVKAGLVKVEGSGKYLTDTEKKEKTTELLAVLKCVTVNETLDGSEKVKDDVASGQLNHSLGTHFVRGVTYGAEMVASLSIKSSSSSETVGMQGKAEGKLAVHAVANVGLKAELKKLTSKCKDTADISIKYYATDLPDKLPTTLDDLVELIEAFPSRLKDINYGKGIPLQFELLPISAAPGIQTAEFPCQHTLNPLDEELMEQYFDDLQSAHSLVKKYEQSSEEDDDDDLLEFIEQINTVSYKIRDAISVMNSTDGKAKVHASLDAYQKALDGRKITGKFCRKWRKILKTKTESSKLVTPATTIKLPEGKPLTVVLLGKTGNGKSATGNSIVGEPVFEEKADAQSVTTVCQMERRVKERKINVIDTPGVIDTSIVMKMGGGRWLSFFKKDQERVLTEVAKIFLLAPEGFDAISLVVKYGCRFTPEDDQALQLLQSFLGKEAETYMFVILSNADQAKRNAKKDKITVDECIKRWLASLPPWVTDFITRIGQNNVIYFDNSLEKDENLEDCRKQLSHFIQAIDDSVERNGGPFIHGLTKSSKVLLEKRIKKALRDSGLDQKIEELLVQKIVILEKIKQNHDKQTREILQSQLKELDEMIRATKTEKLTLKSKFLVQIMTDEKGGCFPGSAMFIDKHGRQREMSSMRVDDEVQVIANNKIRFEPVITFIHRQSEVIQEFLQITTERNNILKITEDHLLFVEKTGRATAIPGRDVKVGDTLYVRAGHSVEKDAVLSISKVYEEGVYAPVTLSGTILVNNVHTSCYFDVLSHEWSHRAMGVARAVHYMSPWILQWISGIGQKDGFPGWCRLAHKMLALSD